MAEKKIDSVRPGITSSSSHLASMHGNDFVELVWQNGQILVQGGSPSGTRKRPSCISYSVHPSREAFDEDPCITKGARLNPLYSLLDSSHQNSQQTNDQCSYPFDLKYPKSNGLSTKLGNEFSNLRAEKESNFKPTGGITQVSTSSSQSQKHDLGSNQRAGKLNFSNFLRPALFFKSAYQGTGATQHTTRVEEFKAADRGSSKAPDHSVAIDSAKGSHSLNGIHHEQTALTSNKANPTPFVAKCNPEALPDDEHSEALGHDSALKTHGSHGQYHNQTHRAKGVASSSLCSLGASNDPTLHSRKHEDTDDSTFVSDNDEETEDFIKETPAREGSRGKRSRNAEIHNLSERKRRDKINKKLRTLKELIPNCNKMDKASMLDDAIDYLKTLKLQLQVMSMGGGVCMPLMMLPGGGGGHEFQLPHQLMSMRPGIGIPCSLPPQFPNVPQVLPPHPQPRPITPNGLQMLGFPNQMLPIQFPLSYPPFISTPPKPIQPNLSAHLATLDDPDLNAQLICTMQASNQGTK